MFGWFKRLLKKAFSTDYDRYPSSEDCKHYEDLNENDAANIAPDSPERQRPDPVKFEDGKAVFPGGVVFDPVEFRQFQQDHPEYSKKPEPKFKVVAHPAVGKTGIAAVGISLHGAPDPGPTKGLIEYLSGEDAE